VDEQIQKFCRPKLLGMTINFLLKESKTKEYRNNLEFLSV